MHTPDQPIVESQLPDDWRVEQYKNIEHSSLSDHPNFIVFAKPDTVPDPPANVSYSPELWRIHAMGEYYYKQEQKGTDQRAKKLEIFRYACDIAHETVSIRLRPHKIREVVDSVTHSTIKGFSWQGYDGTNTVDLDNDSIDIKTDRDAVINHMIKVAKTYNEQNQFVKPTKANQPRLTQFTDR